MSCFKVNSNTIELTMQIQLQELNQQPYVLSDCKLMSDSKNICQKQPSLFLINILFFIFQDAEMKSLKNWDLIIQS